MRCQSCGILIMKPDEFGTTANRGVKMLDYCRYCYDKGQFIEPDLTLEDMVTKLAEPMKMNKNISDEQAREQARAILIGLKRWKPKQQAEVVNEEEKK